MFIAFILPHGTAFHILANFPFPVHVILISVVFWLPLNLQQILKGWEDVNKLGVKQEGENPIKTKSLGSSKLHPHHGTT